MLQQLVKRLFGPSIKPLPAMSDPPSGAMNPDGSFEPKHWGTVGSTEQRLREANRRSWHTSAKGWSEILGRFSR